MRTSRSVVKCTNVRGMLKNEKGQTRESKLGNLE